MRTVLMLLLAASLAAAGDFSRQVLGERDKDGKEQKAVRGRKGEITAEDVAAIVGRERHSSTVSLVAGMYFEKGDYETGKTVGALRALAAREGFWGKAAAMAAWSPHVEKILRDLIASRSEASRTLAATVAATYAHAAWLGNLGAAAGDEPARKKARKKDPAARNVPVGRIDVEPFVAKLLEDRSPDVLELAALAAAYAELESLGARIVRLDAARAPGLEGARLLFLAVMGRELPEDTARTLLRARLPVPKRFTKLTPLLHSYDVRGTAHLYACQAVAEAADKRVLDEMHRMLGHPDLRVQIEAARAIEAIGDRASVPVLLAKLKAEPPWPVKVAVLSAIGAIPARESVDPLLSLLKAELGRLRQDAAYALLSIIPQLADELQFKWDQWWEEHGETFQVDPAATKRFRDSKRMQDIEVASLTDFYGGKIISNRVVFVLDTKHRASANDSIQYLELSWGTRTFDAIETGTRLPEMDTIVYLSDAAPVAGTFEDWDRIVGVFDLYNRYRPVAIQCILYGGKGGKQAGKGRAGGMGRLAGRNVGVLSVADEAGQVEQKR